MVLSVVAASTPSAATADEDSSGPTRAPADSVAAIQPHPPIDPLDTDSNISSATKNPWGYHLAWPVEPSRSPGSISDSLLYLFLPATATTPSDYTLVQQEAVDLGYHVIGLAYPNTDAVIGICNEPKSELTYEARQACYLNVRQQTLGGVPRDKTYTDISDADTIYNRLTNLLVYLDEQYPDEAWGGFLDETGAPKWSRIVVAGHSQGGGNAALIGKLHLVARVVMMSSPPDGCFDASQSEPDTFGNKLPTSLPGCVDPTSMPPTVPGAQWANIPSLTPADRYYGLAHQSEFAITPMLANWGTKLQSGQWANVGGLGLLQFGTPVIREDSAPPYDCAHMLITRLPPPENTSIPDVDTINVSLRDHRLTARNLYTPTDATGAPVLRDAWRYISAVSPGSLNGCDSGA
jgi:hypothetical protein